MKNKEAKELVIEELEYLIKRTSKNWKYSIEGERNCAARMMFGNKDTSGIKSNLREKLTSKFLYFLLAELLKYKKGEISKERLMEFIDKGSDDILKSHREISIEKSLRLLDEDEEH